MLEDNNLGVGFGDMLDLDQLIDTDTGQLVKSDTMPDGPKKDIKDDENHPDTPSKDGMINVNVDKDISSSDDGAQGGGGDDSLLLKNKVLESISRALYEKGVISELDEEKFKDIAEDADQAELLINMIKSEIDKNVSGYKTSLPDKIKRVIDNYEEGVPLDVLIGLESANTRLDGITEEQIRENNELQKILIRENYKRTGISEAKIEKRIQQFDDLNQLEEEALEAFKEGKEYIQSSIENEKTKAIEDRKSAEENRDKSLKDLQKDINGIEQLIDGIKISDREKTLIYESMTKVIDQDKQGNPMNAVMKTRSKNPLGFEKLLHYYHSLGLFNIEEDGTLSPNISKIKAGAKASAMDELNSAMINRQSSSAGTPAKEPKADTDKMKANIAAMKSIFG